MSLLSINFLHLTVSEKLLKQIFSTDCVPAHLDAMGECNNPTVLKGCGDKITRTSIY